MNTRRPSAQVDTHGDPTTATFLALYLIVLAFFILLNAISHRQEDRAKAVLGSIGAKFSEPTYLVATGPLNFAGGTGVFKAVNHFQDAVRELFQSAFPFAKIAPYQPFGQMVVTLPVESVFAPASPLLLAERLDFLDQLAGILNRETPGQAFEVEVLLPLMPATARRATPARLLAVNRVGSFARHLASREVSVRRISVGIDEGDPEIMRLLFFARTVDTDTRPAGRGGR